MIPFLKLNSKNHDLKYKNIKTKKSNLFRVKNPFYTFKCFFPQEWILSVNYKIYMNDLHVN